jgi:hypothetical protein
MSKLVTGLVAILMATTSLAVAEAQPARRGPPSGRGGPCGGPLVGEAPDIMTYDRATGTQVFVGGGKGGDSDVSTFNAQTGSAAALKGDLSKPGLVSSCAVDGFNNQSYGVTSDRPGELNVNSRDGRGDRWAFTRADGRVEIWDPRGDNRCFKSGTGLFNSGVRAAGC